MIPILEKRQRIWVDNFNMLPGWQEKYAYLIDLGDGLGPIPEIKKTFQNRLKSCLSSSYFCVDKTNEILKISGYSNSNIPAGLIALMIAIFDGVNIDDVRHSEIFFHIDSGLIDNLSGNRREGLIEMINRTKNMAR